MKRYKITIIKKYDFELDGYTRKRTIIKIKKVNKGGYYETDN